jgi:DNA replication and repair protein RecF
LACTLKALVDCRFRGNDSLYVQPAKAAQFQNGLPSDTITSKSAEHYLTMHLRHLSLTHFRNYGRLELSLPPGPILLHGNNAQGKTNLLEAVYYLATTRSPHTYQDQQIIHWEANSLGLPVAVGRVVAEIETEQGLTLVELRLIQETRGSQTTFRREALVNKRKVRLMDLLGTLRVVLFLPEDIQLITGAPADRRRYLDITLCQVDRAYCRTLSSYNKVLEQRNALLRQIIETGSGRDLLPIYTEKLVNLGSKIFAQRARQMGTLAQESQDIHYEQLTGGQESLRLLYLPRLDENGSRSRDNESIEDLLEAAAWIQQVDEAEIASRFEASLHNAESGELQSSTVIGPHRDDWTFWLNGRPLAQYGSRGQQRTAMLGLKLAEITWMEALTGDKPILLLDEVVAELDERRRALLLDVVSQSSQAILTATDPTMFTPDFLQDALTLRVNDGRIIESAPQPSPAPFPVDG